LRIVIYYPRASAGDGGLSGAVRRLARELVLAGGRVTMVFDEAGDHPGDDGVRWRHARHLGAGWLRAPASLDDVLGDADVLVMKSGWVLHNVRAGAMARRAGVPYVLAPRGAYDPHIVTRRQAAKRAWWAAAERSLVRHARAVHLFFESELPHLRELGYRGPVVVAPNGVEPPAGAAWDGGSGGYVVWIGRFDPEHKGLDLLLRAVATLPEDRRMPLRIHGPDWHGRKREVAGMVDALGLRPWVALGPAVYGRPKWEALSRATGFVYPSRWEAFGNSPAEAIALGLPTLMTPYPLGRLLGERGGALLAQPTQASLAEGLRELVSPCAAKVGAAGARILREEFSWRAVARSWLDQLEAVL
jgi:glycosyltransferase involved in cell wall biosynthesis